MSATTCTTSPASQDPGSSAITPVPDYEKWARDLYQVVYRNNWDNSSTVLNSVLFPGASGHDDGSQAEMRQKYIDALFSFTDFWGRTTLHMSLARNPPLSFVEAVYALSRLDVRKRNLFSIPASKGQCYYPLHNAALFSNDVKVVEFVIARFQPALLIPRSDVDAGHDSSEYRLPPRLPFEMAAARLLIGDPLVLRPVVDCLEVSTARWRSLRNQIEVKLCIKSLKVERDMTAVVARTDVNDLDPSGFVYKVLDMMMNCGMQPQAEWIVSLVR